MENETMLKKILFAVAPMMLMASSVMADDDLLSKVASMDLSGASNASVAAVASSDDLGQADVDALMGDTEQSGEEAVAASFRRFGHGYRSYGHRYHYGYRNYGWGNHYSYYRPYRHHYYTPVVYSCYTPVYSSYWGCW